MSNNKLYIIDATAFCYRAFYAIRNLSTSFGQPTNAVFGFIKMLNKILKEHKPQYLAVCFDVSRDTVRKKKFAGYKIQRPPMPEGLSAQIPLIKEVIAAYGIAIFEMPGYEADDIIATLAKKAEKKGFSCVIVSSDKDMLQLVDEHTVVFSPYKDEGKVYDHKEVLKRFGVAAQRIVDVLALAGDAADNIPGVCGIGEKTAVGLIKEFGTLDNLLAKEEKIGSIKLKEAIKSNVERIKMNRELVILNTDLDIDFDPAALRISGPNLKELFRLFKYLEFKAFLKELPAGQDEGVLDSEVSILKDAQLKGIFSKNEELIVYGENSSGLLLGKKGKIFKVKKAGRNLKKLLSDPEVLKIGHDLKKTKIALAKEDVVLEGLHYDTMIAAYLINPSKPRYTLNDLAWDYLEGINLTKSLEPAQSVSAIANMIPKLNKELSDKLLEELFADIEMPLTEVLSDMELTGIRLDLKVLAQMSEDLEKRLIKLVEEIYEMSGTQFNINSPKQLRDILFEKLKLPVVKKTKTGPSTDEEVLNKLASLHKLPVLLIEYRQITKLKTTYIDALPNLVNPKTHRIHTCFNQTGTETGRLSSSNPNLQNIPIKTELGRQIRRAVIAFSDNSYLLSCDYSQIELRILAHLCKDKNLTKAFKSEEDIHRATSALIYGVEEKDVNDEMRERAKRVNFGIIYGLTFYGLSRDLGITNDEAQRFIDTYFLKYPKVKEYIQEQILKAQKQGFVSTILGRRRYLPEIHNKNMGIRQFAQRQAVNTPIQGSASDLIKLAMVKIYKKLKENNFKTKMILQIHDELLFDVPENEVKKALALIKDGMENVEKLDVPIKVDIKIGKNWLEMKEVGDEDTVVCK